MPKPLIEAVIWDFGGVITTSPFDAFLQFEADRGLPRNFIRQVNSTSPDSNAWARLERAEIGAEGFDRDFADEARALGHEVRGADVLALLSGTVRPRMVAALELCRAAGLKLGCITNNAPIGHGAGMSSDAGQAAAVADVLDRFDHVIESSKIGMRKPDPRIYTAMCDLLGFHPKACAFLDDLGINCKPAAALGMTAIKVVSEDQALADLGQALGISF